MQRIILTVLLIPLLASAAYGRKALEIIFIDVEGGASTLVVTPAGQSLLIDAGYGGREGRDPARILAAAADVGVDRIDYLLINTKTPYDQALSVYLNRRAKTRR